MVSFIYSLDQNQRKVADNLREDVKALLTSLLGVRSAAHIDGKYTDDKAVFLGMAFDHLRVVLGDAIAQERLKDLYTKYKVE